MTSLNSPDRGSWTFTVDAYGRKASSTDPRGVIETRSYDLLDRLTSTTFSDASISSPPASLTSGPITESFTYDSCSNGAGKLCEVSDSSGTTAFSYDALGRMTGRAWSGLSGSVASGVTLSVGYGYNSLGQKTSMVYPSGKVVAITYGASGKQSSVSYNSSSIASGVSWDANDHLLGWTFGMAGLPAASQNVSMTYDWDGQLSALNDIDARTYSYNNNGQATGIADSASAHSQSFGYSSSRRLTFMSAGNWSSPLNYAYDATGNETRKSDSTSGKNFTIATSSNRISATYPDGSSPTSWTYDAMGSLVTDAVGHTLSYDVKGRLAQAISSGSLAQYTYDAFGNRKTKVIAGTGAASVIFMEGDDGELLGSYTPTGSGAFSVQEERVDLDDGRTIATIRPSPTAGMSAPIAYPILTDQLGAPRKVLGPATGAVIWLWDSKEAYGYQSPNEDPGSTGQPFHLNARMPGQELDAETGFFHNGFRDYDPASGRYVESDPLGLAAGWNTYAYVGGDPVMMIDPLGLSTKDVLRIIKAFNDTVVDMNKHGQRDQGEGWWSQAKTDMFAMRNSGNPWYQILNLIHDHYGYLNCDGQSQILLNNLNYIRSVNGFDDHWEISPDHSDNHNWVVLIPDPRTDHTDPTIWLDPWRNNLSLNKPCYGCDSKAHLGEKRKSK
jgi:RHS repeat-associated protein